MKRFNLLVFTALSSAVVSVALSCGLPAVGQVSPATESAGTIEAEEPTADAPAVPEIYAPDLPEADPAEPDPPDAETADTDSPSETTESETVEADSPPRLSEADRIRRKLLIQADSEYEAGNFAEAEALYRQAKDQTWLLPRQFASLPPEPFSDEAQLSPAAAVYWREAQAGIANERSSQALVALALITAEHPAFIPGHVQYAETLRSLSRAEEANAVLENALTEYPDQTDLILAQVDLLMDREQWLEAAITSRQFVALNGDHPAAPAQAELAQENLERFQRKTRADIRTGALANLFTGVLGYAFTGSIFGPFTAANSAILLLQGENAIGNQYASRIQQQLPMLEDPEALGYVRRIGNRLAAVTGRRDLDYEFFVILDPDLNAFALPGGKVFVNAGAILSTRSEAELAGLLAHELSHSVLSHGFQIATRGNLSSSVAQYLPYGGLINNVFLSGYSRQMERQSDIVGTQILAAGGYAADGLHNVMVTLNEEVGDRPRAPAWLSSHPNPEDRVTYLKTLVERGGYDRYTYEGVVSHEEIQAIVARELAAYEAEQDESDSDAEATDSEETQTDLYDAVDRFDW